MITSHYLQPISIVLDGTDDLALDGEPLIKKPRMEADKNNLTSHDTLVTADKSLKSQSENCKTDDTDNLANGVETKCENSNEPVPSDTPDKSTNVVENGVSHSIDALKSEQCDAETVVAKSSDNPARNGNSNENSGDADEHHESSDGSANAGRQLSTKLEMDTKSSGGTKDESSDHTSESDQTPAECKEEKPTVQNEGAAPEPVTEHVENKPQESVKADDYHVDNAAADTEPFEIVKSLVSDHQSQSEEKKDETIPKGPSEKTDSKPSDEDPSEDTKPVNSPVNIVQNVDNKSLDYHQNSSSSGAVERNNLSLGEDKNTDLGASCDSVSSLPSAQTPFNDSSPERNRSAEDNDLISPPPVTAEKAPSLSESVSQGDDTEAMDVDLPPGQGDLQTTSLQDEAVKHTLDDLVGEWIELSPCVLREIT